MGTLLSNSKEVVQFSHSVVSDSLRPHGLHLARLLCLSPTPRACSNSCPLRQWCHPTISSAVVPFSSCLQSFPASGSFQISHLFTSGGQSIGISASVLPMNIQDWFPLGWIGLISLQSKGLSRVFSNTQFKSFSSLVLSFLYGPSLTPIHDCWKSHSFDYTFVCKVMSLLFNMLSRFVTAFLPRNSSVQFSHWVMSDSLGPHGLQHTRPPCPSPTPRVYSSSCHLSWWCHPAILSSIVPIFSHPQSFPTLNLFQHQGLFKWDSSSHQVAKVLEFLLQHQSFQWIFRTDVL